MTQYGFTRCNRNMAWTGFTSGIFPTPERSFSGSLLLNLANYGKCRFRYRDAPT